MISTTTTGVEAGEWFESLPNDNDRRTVEAIISLLFESNYDSAINDYTGRYFASYEYSYTGLYAIGSRARMAQTEASDIDLLLATNNFDIGYDTVNMDFGLNKEYVERAAAEPKFDIVAQQEKYLEHVLGSSLVAQSTTMAIAASSEQYRLPYIYDGSMPDAGYSKGGKDHKAVVKYKDDEGYTDLDMVYYGGFHFDDGRCGPSCKDVEEEGSNQSIFEEVIDTEDTGEPLGRIPLFTKGDSKIQIYIPQIRDKIVTACSARMQDPDQFSYDWELHPLPVIRVKSKY